MMKRGFSVFLVILMISLVFFLTACNNLVGEAGRQKILPAYQEKCSDSDEGINLEEKGTTTGLMLMRDGTKKPATKIDICVNGKLTEYYCSRNLIKSTIKTCTEEEVCEDGECKVVTEYLSICENNKCDSGENWESCFGDCIQPYYDFVEQYKQQSGTLITEEELFAQINNIQTDETKLNSSEIKDLINQGLNIDFMSTDLSQEGFDVKIVNETEHLEYIERELLFATPYIGTFNAILLIPKNYPTPRPAILGLHGHGDSSIVFKEDYFGEDLVQEGFIVLMPSLRAMSCDGSGFEKSISVEMLLNGFSLMGIRVYEASLLVNYLKSLNNVDSSMIGILAHSGGSVVTNLLKKTNENVLAIVYDYESNFVNFCGPEEMGIHCETIPILAPYYEQINQKQSLSLKLEYGYPEEGDYQTILDFFHNSLVEDHCSDGILNFGEQGLDCGWTCSNECDLSDLPPDPENPPQITEGCYFNSPLECLSYQINNNDLVFTVKNTGLPLTINQITHDFMDEVAGQNADCLDLLNLNISIEKDEEVEIDMLCEILNNYVGLKIENNVQIVAEQNGEEKIIDGTIIGVVGES